LAVLTFNQLKKHLSQASSLMGNHRFGEAEFIYKEILSAYPSHPEALTMLATVFFNQSRLNDGISLIEKSIEINPFQPDAFNNYAIALRELSRFDDALEKVQQAIKLRPNFYNAYYNQGLIYRSKGLLLEAIQSYESAIQLNKDGLDSYLNISNIYIELKNFTKALNILSLADQINSNISAIHHNKGLSYLGLDKIDNAIKSFDEATTISPNNYLAYYNQGLAYIKKELFIDALNCFDKVLSIRHDHYDALNKKGFIFQKLKRWKESEAAYELAILADNKNIIAFNNKAIMYIEKKEFKLAQDLLYKSLQLEPDNSEALNIMAAVNQILHEYKAAIDFYIKAVEKDPNNRELKSNLARAYLANSDFENGWPLYENRSHIEELKVNFSNLNRHYINSRPKDDKPILVLSEQGIGDQILFLSLLFEISKFRNKILVALDERLIPLFERSFPSINFYSDKSDLSSLEFSYNLLAGSMGSLFRKSISAFDEQMKGFIKPNQHLSEKIKVTLKLRSKMLCGISWKSENKEMGEAKSLSLEKYKCFFEMNGIEFIDLQYGDTIEERKRVKSQLGVDIISSDFIDKFSDIDGLASLINACDFVITTSNVTAHIAGAIGKKTFLLVPFGLGKIWYWHNSTKRSLWYPSVSIYRQDKNGDWTAAMIEIKKDLEFNN
jgi:tetratricopeptide (TPR) repeat protein